MSLSIKQKELLNKVYLPFKEKYPHITLDEFIFKFTHKNIEDLTHQHLFFLINKVNSGYDYWGKDTDYNTLKPNFNKLKYIIEKETDDYIIGKQYHYTSYLKDTIDHTLKIIAFKYLMILDYDTYDKTKDQLLKDITETLSKTNYTFLIYETKNGYHAYNISKKFKFYESDTYKEMHKLNCDNWYINFTKYVGFVTRLEKKPKREEKFIEKFIKQINDFPIDDNLKNLVKFKDKLIYQSKEL